MIEKTKQYFCLCNIIFYFIEGVPKQQQTKQSMTVSL